MNSKQHMATCHGQAGGLVKAEGDACVPANHENGDFILQKRKRRSETKKRQRSMSQRKTPNKVQKTCGQFDKENKKEMKKKKKKEKKREKEDDILLKQLEKDIHISWRPRRIFYKKESLGQTAIVRIARVVHLDEALVMKDTKTMTPRLITHFSAFQPSTLPEDHPCKNLKVLWFSPQEDEDTTSKYGNVEFSLNLLWALKQWKHIYFMENVSYKTVTLHRLLLTNTDYGKLFRVYGREEGENNPYLLPYDATHPCAAFEIKPFPTVRNKSPRFKNEPRKFHNLIVEFLIEATPKDCRDIYFESEKRYKDHHPKEDEEDGYWCHTFERRGQECQFNMDRYYVKWQMDQYLR